ncbi:MAG TPA: hypothetical protein VMT70_10515 [Vicinamibacteria bacterium]|nr:hypothetical protein [Vicinamibacteria bacterium]
MAALLLGLSTMAAAETVVGVVTAVSGDEVRVKTRHGEERVATLNVRTAYARWITHKPWQQETVADRAFVKAGRCVAVELQRDDPRVAKVVRISPDEVGTVYSPCL